MRIPGGNCQPSADGNGEDLTEAEVPQVDHRVGQGLERVVQLTDAIEANEQALERLNLSSQANTRSMVLNRSLKMTGSKSGLRPRLGVFLPRRFSLMLGIMSRLKMAFRFFRQS